ncbi:MAG: YdeI/OmpD-associated family protein [Deltaproteobacteria bacterium]|nr:YdeI/OmpD-associated family protein [Deltaproteobacteria bacterium]
MPDHIARALEDAGLTAAYEARPPYQRNDWLGWIARARREETRARRLAQMLDELRAGDVYMRMPWRPGRRSDPTGPTPAGTPIDDYLAGLEPTRRATLQQLREDILALAPGAEEGLSYGVPAFRLGGRLLAGFSAASRHLSYLPHSGTVLSGLPAEVLEGYGWSEGALRFPVDRPLPRALVATLLAARRAELGL